MRVRDRAPLPGDFVAEQKKVKILSRAGEKIGSCISRAPPILGGASAARTEGGACAGLFAAGFRLARASAATSPPPADVRLSALRSVPLVRAQHKQLMLQWAFLSARAQLFYNLKL